MNKRFSVGKIIMIAFFGILAVLVFAWIVMSLWNAILPNVLHVSQISFLQALGILVLSKILFGGFRGRGGWGGGPRSARWKQKMEEKMSKMSPEERAKLTQHLRDYCGPWKAQATEEKPADSHEAT